MVDHWGLQAGVYSVRQGPAGSLARKLRSGWAPGPATGGRSNGPLSRRCRSGPSIVSSASSRWASSCSRSRWDSRTLRAVFLAASRMVPISRVDLLSHRVAVAGSLGELLPQEDSPLARIKGLGPELLAHAVLGYHLPGDAAGVLQVVGGAGGYVADHHCLRRLTSHHHCQHGLELTAGPKAPVLVG